MPEMKDPPPDAAPLEIKPEMLFNLFIGIKEVSGLSNVLLAENISKQGYISLTDKLISDYIHGRKTMGYHRMLAVARSAQALGWETMAVKMLLLYEEVFSFDQRKADNEERSKLNKAEGKSQKAALIQLQKSVANLVSLNFDNATIIGLVIALTQQLFPLDEQSKGGLVELAWMQNLFEKSGANFPGKAWLIWRFMDWQEAENFYNYEAGEKEKSKVKRSLTFKLSVPNKKQLLLLTRKLSTTGVRKKLLALKLK